MVVKNNVPHGTIDRFIDLLTQWNKKVNLVSNSSINELYDRHIKDSLQLTNFIKEDEIIYDLGSGAGFPGIILSYVGIKEVNLIEKITKKANFLRVASSLSSNKIIIHNCAVEDVKSTKCNVITARGFAELNKIFEISYHLISPVSRFVLLKGKKVEDEIKNALENWQFEYIIEQSQTSEDGKILIVKNLIRK